MGSSKALLALALFMATIILISSEAAPKDIDENLDTNDGEFDTNGVEESKIYRGGYYGGPWRRGHGWRGGYGGYCRYGCCRWGYYGGCRRCCYYPGERVEAHVDGVEPYN